MTKKAKVVMASDHAGFELKESLKPFLKELGFEAVDMGTSSADSVDYPDFAKKLAREVSCGKYERGILICGTGIGMSIAANRYKGIRAALVTSEFQAEMAARHNNANVIVFGGRITGRDDAKKMLKIWLETQYEGGRHDRRLAKIEEP